MPDLKIHTAIHSRYQVFDLSGALPFSIVFGLCRRSTADTDPRSLIIDIAESALDVPYALASGLLTLHESRREEGLDGVVDKSRLAHLRSEGGSKITLSSPVGRTQHWRNAFAIFQYPVDPGSELGALFKAGQRYTIQLAGPDLGVQRYQYDEQQSTDLGAIEFCEKPKLINSKSSAGKASFTVVPTLPAPPRLRTSINIREEQKTSADDDETQQLFVNTSVLNTGSQPITVQTRGQQRFLVPWGPFQPEEDSTADSRPRAIDPESQAPASSFEVVDTTSGQIVRAAAQPGVCSLTEKHDPRPELAKLLTLEPGKPLERRIDLSARISGLPDGQYGVRLEPRGMWWCLGSCEDFARSGEDRVPHELYNTTIPPVVLESEDTVTFSIQGGRLKTN
ncbi:hypothetical protein CB0940_09419 [Cercospora beticola]|uniref:Uncharacterized protein n=1 Tax=Cercospora beticola TaxID=122368 RepID=A0A2G5HIX0_CERBT|nr:hypothetical protein CB0940_09419 [Cercospora beticola]PIA92162.1 hypothetical protein CB0940_09419 [Cercospora beticola]WPB06265.1 hypothetical protein RHO25_010922 [Cercospora beticola]CAK1366150.1 unnamed protein product [Cercospora beticola]